MSSNLKASVILFWMLHLKWQLIESQFFSGISSSMQDKILKNHVQVTYDVTAGLGDCFMKCTSHEICFSLNFHQVTSVCELNDATHKYLPWDFHNASNVIYMVYSVRPEPAGQGLLFPRKSIEDKVVWENPFLELSAFTIVFWVLGDSATGDHGVFQVSSVHHNEEIGIQLFSYGNFFLVRGSAIEFTENLIDDKWHHVAFKWDKTTGDAYVYVDGKLKKNGTLAKGDTIPSQGVLVLGQEMDGHYSKFSSVQALQGKLANVNLWNRSFSADEIVNIYRKGMCAPLHGNVIPWYELKKKRFGLVQEIDDVC